MLRGLFKMFLLSKLFGGAGRTGGGGRKGCGGIGCIGIIILAVLAYLLFQYLGGNTNTTDF